MDAEGGGATGRVRSLFHQTTTTGNTDKTHLLMYDAVGPVVCEGSPEKKKTISDSDRFKGKKENVFLENVGVLSDR